MEEENDEHDRRCRDKTVSLQRRDRGAENAKQHKSETGAEKQCRPAICRALLVREQPSYRVEDRHEGDEYEESVEDVIYRAVPRSGAQKCNQQMVRVVESKSAMKIGETRNYPVIVKPPGGLEFIIEIVHSARCKRVVGNVDAEEADRGEQRFR